jgi:hypothetical protein
MMLLDVVDLEARRRDDAWIFEVDCGTEQVVEEEQHDDVLQPHDDVDIMGYVFLCFVVFLLIATVAAVALAAVCY